MSKKKKEEESKIDLIPLSSLEPEDEGTEKSASDTEIPSGQSTEQTEEEIEKIGTDRDDKKDPDIKGNGSTDDGGESAEETTSVDTKKQTDGADGKRKKKVDKTTSKSEDIGDYVKQENKWERKNRIRDEKEKKKVAKKRAKYADVDDETYESMKAGPGRVTFGVFAIIILLAGIGLSALGVYKLMYAPDYAKVVEEEKMMQIEGMATAGDAASLEQRMEPLKGVATPSDLVDTWIEQKTATASDADSEEQSEEITGESDEESADNDN